MQLYHHPYSMDSQRVRLALEEKGIDYTSYHANPLTGKNLDSSFIRMNPTGNLPLFKNGSHIILRTIDILRYIDRLKISSPCDDEGEGRRVEEWMEKLESWNPRAFTLARIPEKHRDFVKKFLRRVTIARMSESPDLASIYHAKLRDCYEEEEKIKDLGMAKESEEQLRRLLDEAEEQLGRTVFLAGDRYSAADSMFVPVLARVSLLDLKAELFNGRTELARYFQRAKRRPSFKLVIGKHFSGWNKYRTLLKTVFFLAFRNLLRRY
ncbi:glutathione S-transferase TCHQD-like isoform X2 [Wolffia australiana]